MQKYKKCARCKKSKKINNYGKDKNRPDGLICYCKDCLKKIQKQHYIKNSKKIIEACLKRRKLTQLTQKQIEKRRKTRRIYTKTDYYKMAVLRNPLYKLRRNISRQLRRILNGQKNKKRWEKLIGYSIDELKRHLESQFQIGMTWENYGKWHIDHIKPIVCFNLGNRDLNEIRECWSLTNLQPLWAHDNLVKHCKFI